MHSPHSCALFSVNWEAKADSKQLLVQCSFSETFEAADKRRELKLTNASSLQQLSLIPSPNTHPKYSRIPPLESDIDNWSQISVGRSQKDLLFTPTQLSISHSLHSPTCSIPSNDFPTKQELKHRLFRKHNPFHCHGKPAETQASHDPDPEPLSSLLIPSGLSDISKTFETVMSSLWLKKRKKSSSLGIQRVSLMLLTNILLSKKM